MDSCIVYIGDFDFRNENVQAHLVKNNGKCLTALGYHVEYIGVNRQAASFESVASLPPIHLDNGNDYFELPYTLSAAGLVKTFSVCKSIIQILNELIKKYTVSYVITYQAPTYAVSLKKTAAWCKRNNIPYIVNCADLPTFELQSLVRRLVMKANWAYMHKINKKYADGVIAVSKYIDEFYRKPGRPSVVIPPLFDVSECSYEASQNETATFIYAGTPFKITGHEASPEGMKDRLDKVIDYFLTLSRQGEGFVLNIVGIGKEDYVSGVPRHAQALMNENKIKFFGKLNHEKTLRMVAESDFSVNYRDENLMTKAGFSTKIVESVSLGTPVVINNISDTFDYLKWGVTGVMFTGVMESDMGVLSELCHMSIEQRQRIKWQCKMSRIFVIERFVTDINTFLIKISEKRDGKCNG